MERNLTHIALFAAMIVVLGLIPKIDLGIGVPITAQSLGIMLCGTILGAWRGGLAVLLFLGLGLIGLPVLSGGRTVMAALSTPSVGYLIGYPVAAFVAGLVVARWKAGILPAAFAGAAIGGIVVLYAFGIPGIALMAGKPLGEAFLGAMVFLPGDLIKAVLAALITRAVAQARPGALLSRA
jgi:biotin transport system substrate-specific component